LAALRDGARAALAGFAATVGRLGVDACEQRLTDDSLIGSLTLQSRYCDLAVVPQAAPGGSFVPQQLILHSPRPVVVVPGHGEFTHVAERPLLAWDGGMAASRAIEAALPLLRRARLVTLAVFNPDSVYAAHGPEPGADLARFLARHNVQLEVVVRDTDGDVGDGLLALAGETGADLLVMGCYGHTRVRELLVGGTSRTVLKQMTLPVLMMA
ncbi:universal stress protein, partial [Duganella callida]|uniref:universal stress protein n=1 Tax=Duganella callida TaxID=2561932 RepID=UPI00142FABC2